MSQSLRVLIAEDNDDLRAGLHLLINSQPDLECVGQTAGLDEVEPLALATRADVIVLDLELRGTSSLKRLPEWRVNLPETHFVVFSGHDNPRLISGALEAGASAYVLKAQDISELLQTIRSLGKIT